MLVGIDIGSHKVCTLVGEPLPGGGLRVTGIGHAPAAGIRRGEIIDVDEAAGAIAASVVRAERVSGQSIDRAVVGITGRHLEGQNHASVIACGRRPREITKADIDRSLQAATSIPLPLGRELIHVLPQGYTLDDAGPIKSPIGMEGYRLAADVHLVTGEATSLSNLRRCLALAEVTPSRFTVSTLAASEAVLTPDEKELGVAVADLGASATGLACYVGGALVHTVVLPVGGQHLTQDLAKLFQTPLAQAEKIKVSQGHALPELDDDTTAEIDVVPFGDGERRVVTRRAVSEVLAARVDEIAHLIQDELSSAQLNGRLPAGMVLVGGGTELAGLARRLRDRLALPVRVGRPSQVIGLSEATRGPDHAAAVGLLLWRARGAFDAATGIVEKETETAGMTRFASWLWEAFLPARSGR